MNERSTGDMIRLPGGTFRMGTDASDGFPDDGEGPVHKVRLSPFFMDQTAVTNEAFAAFVSNTGHITAAERYGWSFVFHLFLPGGFAPTRAIACAPWWRQVEGASWRHPEGPQSTVDDRLDHPVTHVSWHDAVAFARWAKKRLPSEAEWEYAARGGLAQARYPWGDELMPGGVHRCNIWQGTFPLHNTCDDGFAGTAPAQSFEPNGHGLYNTSGNVWEWCADWFSQSYYRSAGRVDPRGPLHGHQRVIRGGSYLCHASYCNRYRVAARSHNEPESSTGNTGFRCARDA
ncbi:MAG TPA: formylglycine-generating enzyme family protein [Kofleriaceae bacterium]|nr:formylglycine-generating enzyme family protein [Kofleriaceae bacterium]